jgi:hypothetical protein
MLKKVLITLGVTASLAVVSYFLWYLFAKYLLETCIILYIWITFMLFYG